MTTTSKKLVPNKRFPEFENSGEWVDKKLKEYCDIIVGGDAPEKFSKERTEQFSIPIYSNGVGEKMLYGYTNKARVFDECVTVSARGTIGYTVYHNKPFYPIVRLLCLVPNKLLCTLFLKYQLDIVNIEGTQVGISQLTAPMVSEYHILVPLLNEQQIIADFLSSVDELIELEQTKLEKLQKYKKGLLENLFPKENQKVPDLRFPEFENSGEWEEKKLGDIVEIIQGVAFPVKYQGKKKGDYPFCKVSDISKANEVNGGYLQIALNYIDELEVKILKSKILPKGTTIFAKIGEAIRLNRRAYLEVQALIDNNIAGIKFQNKEYYDLYLFHYMHIIDFNNYISGVIPSLNKSILQQIVIKLPSYKEQQKIADFLSSVDELIIEQTTKLQLLYDYKKGLLQQLFPN